MLRCRRCAGLTSYVLQITLVLLIVRDATSGHVLREKREIIDSGTAHTEFNETIGVNHSSNENIAIPNNRSAGDAQQLPDIDGVTTASSATATSTTDVNNAIATGQTSDELSSEVKSPPFTKENDQPEESATVTR